MSFRLFFTITLLLFGTSLRAQPNCVEAEDCKSQLFRFEISSGALSGASNLLPLLQNLAGSEGIRNLIQQPRTLSPIAIPPKKELCVREKSLNNPLFAQIDCNNHKLCEKSDLNPEVRMQLCFNLPCPIFEGTLQAGKCNGVSNVFTPVVSFPEPLRITNSRMVPTSVDFRSPQANICFRIEELSLTTAVQLNLDTKGTALADNNIRLSNISPTLDGPRNVCVRAQIDLRSPTPVTNLKIETMDQTPFISDTVIREASAGIEIAGLSGYPAGDIDRIKTEIIPPLMSPLRETVESSIKSALGKVFEDEINRLARVSAGSSVQVSTQTMMTEAGLGNLRFRESLSRVQCRALASAKRPIPSDHPCRSIDMFGDQIGSSIFSIGLMNELKGMKREGDLLNITSERIKQELIELKEVMRAERSPNDNPDDTSRFAEDGRVRFREYIEENIATYVDPLIEKISQNQLRSQIVNFVEFQDMQQGSFGRNVGVSVPEICSDTNPSAHARRSMPNCPIQAYTDLNEMNRLFDRMWRAGNLCQAGAGPYVATSEQYDAEGIPNGSGCEIEMNGLRCFLNSAPAITWDPATRKYKTRVNLKACHRRGIFSGIGRFGGDFTLDLSYIPEVASNGDFTLGRTSASLRVVPGSERFDLVRDSSLRSTIINTIQNAASNALKNSVRIPFASGLQGSSPVPLRPQGRVDTGPGFFGACLTTTSP